MNSVEGVIKFVQDFKKSKPVDEKFLQDLNSWRKILYNVSLVGLDSKRYGGKGYGNLSKRHSIGRRNGGFVITGSQTGGLESLTPQHYAIVRSYNPSKNLLCSEGPLKASSESPTHWALYNLNKKINFVYHVHSPEIWHLFKREGLPATAEDVEYGTPEMVGEVRRLFKRESWSDEGIFIMRGHEDGVVSFGSNSEVPGRLILSYLEDARNLRSA